jgi:hypothetical protein
MRYFDWNQEKNGLLKIRRGISFEEITITIEAEGLVDILPHPNQRKYPNQHIFVVCLQDYVYLVPFVEDEKKIFLKTIIPNRKATKKYIINKQNKK